MPQGVILFPSIHFAMRAEKITKENGFSIKLIPIPRHLSSDCGVCLRIRWEDKDQISEVLTAAGVKQEGAHSINLIEPGGDLHETGKS